MAKPYVVVRSRREELSPDYVRLGDYVDSSGECLVEQSDFEKCDINHIIERYVRTGVLESVQRTNGFYGDFSDITDFHSAHLMVEQANESFMTLPATVRERFQNDPGQFLDFVCNPDNEQEMAEMGLLNEEAHARYVARVNAKAASEAAAEAAPKG